MSTTQAWLQAFRLRTLPLAFSSILMGTFLAARYDAFHGWTLLLTLLTTLFLQILSNLANDYGDFVKGTDNEARVGPSRTVQAGLISPHAMKVAIGLFSFFSLGAGLLLLYVAGIFADWQLLGIFFGTGLLCIGAAITYTVGTHAYGYKGLGDISVLLFFGLVGVLGTYFLMTHKFNTITVLPALACGLLATGVLNLNNLRDIENDKTSGKKSIPVMLGFQSGKKYHYFLIVLSFVLLSIYQMSSSTNWGQYLYLILLPFYIIHILRVKSATTNKELDPFLKQLALLSLGTTILVGIGFFL